jgi:signal transduction histidine kinase
MNDVIQADLEGAVPGPTDEAPASRPAPSPTYREVLRARLSALRAGTRSVRFRILLLYVVILTLLAVLTVVGIKQVLLLRDADRVDDALEQEMAELDRLMVGTDPETGLPFESLEALFDVYLRRNVPAEDEAVLTFIDGQFYRSVTSQYPLDTLPAETIAGWEQLSSADPARTNAAIGRFATPLGEGYFRLARLRIGEHTGAFVVTAVPADDLQEIDQLQTLAILAALIALLIGLSAAWLITGRILAPVRSLTETAARISRSDLTQRIEVSGGGEAADMARSFNAMLDRLEGVFRSQREFVQDASHELRTPLTICRGHLELLPDDPAERAETIALVTDEVDRMARIVTDLQVLADAEHPDFVRRERIDLEPFTHELVAKASALAPRKWILDGTADEALMADRWALTEAVMNLANNAVEHTHDGEVVAIGSSVGQGELQLWVRDEGTGIAVADQSRIFERFQRGSTAHRRYRGSGLGLAIVKAIAEAHGGRVSLVSRVSVGSTFTLHVPVVPVVQHE